MRLAPLALLGWLLWPSASFATLIDEGDVTHDTATKLDWLDLGKTLGQSYDDVIAGTFVAEGWRFATGLEVIRLFQHAGASPDSSPPCCALAEFAPPSLLLGTLMGFTHPDHDVGFSIGLIGVPGANTGTHLSAIFQTFGSNGYMVVPFSAFPDDNLRPDAASFLVRAVPEPGTLALLAPALLLRLRARRR